MIREEQPSCNDGSLCSTHLEYFRADRAVGKLAKALSCTKKEGHRGPTKWGVICTKGKTGSRIQLPDHSISFQIKSALCLFIHQPCLPQCLARCRHKPICWSEFCFSSFRILFLQKLIPPVSEEMDKKEGWSSPQPCYSTGTVQGAYWCYLLDPHSLAVIPTSQTRKLHLES